MRGSNPLESHRPYRRTVLFKSERSGPLGIGKRPPSSCRDSTSDCPAMRSGECPITVRSFQAAMYLRRFDSAFGARSMRQVQGRPTRAKDARTHDRYVLDLICHAILSILIFMQLLACWRHPSRPSQVVVHGVSQ
jgi:hypothetical protein